MALTPLPTPPSTSDPANFATRADALVLALAAMVAEINGGAVAFVGGAITGATSFTAAGTALAVTNNATIGGTLAVTGAATLSSTLGVIGLITMQNGTGIKDSSADAGMFVNTSILYVGKYSTGLGLKVTASTGNAEFTNNLTVTGTMTLSASGVDIAGTYRTTDQGSGIGRMGFISATTALQLSFNSAIAGVSLGSAATSWGTFSDERGKVIEESIVNASSKVSSLRAVIGRYKTDEAGVRRSFLIAQDVLAVLPEAVDVVDPEKLILRYTEVIPLLVAAHSELAPVLAALRQEFDDYRSARP